MQELRRPLLLLAFLSLAAVAVACGEETPPDVNSNPDTGVVVVDGGIPDGGNVEVDGGQADGSIPAPFAIVSVSPPAGSADVAPNTSIAVAFSAVVDPASATTDTLLVFPSSGSAAAKVAGSFSFPADEKTVVFKPQAPLTTSTQYKVVIKGGSAGIASTEGGKLAADVEGTFTTSTELDTVLPTVSSTVPADEATDVPLDQKISIRFSELIDPASLEASRLELIETWYGVPQGDGLPLPGTWDTSDNPTIVFTPAAWFEVGDEMTFTVKAGVRDLAGNAMAADHSIVFDVAWNSPDEVPTVVATSPVDEATGVPTNATLLVTFSERMRQASVTVTDPATVQLFPSADDSARVALQRNTTANPVFAFYPQTALAPNTRYTLKIFGGVDGVEDESQTPMAASHSIHFTTGAGPDTSALLVSAVSPTSGATGVSQVTTVEVTFDKPIDPAKLFLSYPGTAGTFRVSRSSDGSFPEEGTLDFSANPKITFTIASTTTYQLERTYYVKITGGATGVRSLSGATMAENYTSTFTVKAPDQDNATIADLRAVDTVDGVCAIRVRGVYATFFRDVPKGWKGFFVQEDATGPAIFVVTGGVNPPFPIYPAQYSTGYPNIDLTVTKIEEYEGFKQVVAWSATRNTDATVDLQYVKEDLVEVIGDEAITEAHESKYVQIDGTLSNYTIGTTANRLYDLTWGTDRKVKLKVADGIKVPLDLKNGSRVRVLAPIQEDLNGYFIKPYVFTTEEPMTASDLDLPANYDFTLDIVKLAPEPPPVK